MDPTITAAIITGIAAVIVAVLTLVGSVGRYVVSLILDAYKRQAEHTVAAKDQELAAKDQEIERLQDGVTSELSALRTDIRDLRQELRR